MSTINREDAIEAIKEKVMRPDIQRNADTVNGLLGAMNIIYDLPTAEKVGNWIEVKNRWDGLEIRCSECGAQVPRDEWGNAMQCAYCPWCGARMMEEEDENESNRTS